MNTRSIPITCFLGGIPHNMGILSQQRNPSRRQYSYTLTLLPSWLEKKVPLGADIPDGQSVVTSSELFGIFQDASADSFGQQAMKDGRALKKAILPDEEYPLDDFDFFTKTHPVFRQGSFRFPHDAGILSSCQMPSGNLSHDVLAKFATSEDRRSFSVKDFIHGIARLTSSGGAQPKYNFIREKDGRLWMAKSYGKNDFFIKSALFEEVNLSLARICGISVLDFFHRNGWIFVERFDRNEGNRPIPYMSAQTLIGKSLRSYLDLAKGCPHKDRKELFRRMCLNAFVGNCDEHGKNHGFIYQDGEWRLSPLFDVMSMPLPSSAQEHTLLFGDGSPLPSPEGLLTGVEAFGLTEHEALFLMKDTFTAVAANWRDISLQSGATEETLESVSDAYAHGEFETFFAQPEIIRICEDMEPDEGSVPKP